MKNRSNYRVVKYRYLGYIEETVYVYKIHKVYYNEQGEIETISKKPMCAHGSNIVENLEVDLNLMLKALNEPILDRIDLDKKFIEDIIR